MVKKFYNKLRDHFKEVIRIKTTPHSIALGFSIGTFIGIFPTFGLGVLIGLVVVLISKNVSKISLFLSLAIWNPITLVPIYTLGYQIGDFIFGNTPVEYFNFYFLNQLFSFTRRLIVGNTIIAFVISIISYPMIYYLVRAYQKRAVQEFIKEEFG